jgi:hypothetical protein
MEGGRFRSNARPRTLLIPCESARGLATAGRARATFALEEALASRSESCTILPSFEEIPSHSPHAWPYHAPRILGHARFDQAWIWLGRTPFDEIFLAWLASVAPVRIGVLMHPLDYPADAYRRSPHLLAHRSAVEQQLRHLTHVLACDELDAASCAGRLDLPAMWLPATIGASDVSPTADVTRGPRTAVVVDETPDDVSPPPSPPIVRGLARLDVDAEAGSPGDGFAALQREHLTWLATGTVTSADLERYAASRRSIRTDLAQRRARALGQAGIAVTLAPDANAYPIAVLECMAARVPVVCRDIPYRPRNRALFAPEHHIRLFGIGDQASLARHVRDLVHDPSLAQSQADAALALVQRRHTAERRVEQVFEWLSTGRVPDLTWDEDRVQGHPDHSDHPATDRWRLPASYRRRTSPPPEEDRASDISQTITGTGAEGEGHTEAYRVAITVARACGCTRLVDVGCPDPIGLVRASREINATAICAPHVAQSHQRRCSDVAWHDIGSDVSNLLAGVEGETALILCAMQFEIDEAPDVLAATLSQFVARARCGLVVSVDRDRTWGPRDAGPPPTPAHLQEWAPAELAGLLRDAGLAVLHQTAIPAGLGRREHACTATIVVHDTTPEDVRDEVRAAAETACETYARQRALLSEYDLVETVANTPPVFVMAPGPAASDTPALQVLLADDRWMALHSGRAPIEEARRWAERVPCEDDRPIVLFGLGLGYHAIALARAVPGARLIVVEPFPDVIARAREIPATREALDHGRIEIVDGWPAFKALVQARPLPLASICPVSIPVYERVAEEAYATFSTLLHGVIDWARADLDRECKPFLHPEGMSVVITTFNRVERAAALVAGIARQQPCGVPVEILLVNDHGTTAVFDAARVVAERTGCDLRTFDTYYSGYGPALARNVGLRFARYDTTVFLDDDVEVGSDLLRCYHRAPAGIRMGRIDFLHPDGDRLRQVPDRRIALRGPDRILRPWATFEGFMWSANCAVPTEVALALGGFDEAFLNEGEEDLDFSARTIRATHLPVAVPSALALHHELDLSGGVALQAGRTARLARANERLADPTRGLVVNGGVSYWSGDRWGRYIVT